MNKTASRIMDIAESLLRTKGFQGFAFREIANEIGIKSASVHYHFATKGELVEAILVRYIENFEAALLEAEQKLDSPSDRLEHYIKMYRTEFMDNKYTSLCIMLGADIDILPEPVVQQLSSFYRLNLEWISSQIEHAPNNLTANEIKQNSAHIQASLNGALMGARSMEDAKYFDLVVDKVRQQYRLMLKA
ncbi:TetR/AcrR family transcriptional regulator [Reinekea marina]|uniref:TetR/AcrR family transcriptional regulator n=1 Tax=Reinekea marina TaxID=1310421 RepID=A0ABV7WVC4_9GAMM|nr:TetR/AcrR family transcriptional regulator [Reinekea marina]MDN3650983.1 TetR/AcrR family transcriptional regulator [Reinekea marina]